MFGLYIVYYSVGRVWIEAIRIDPSEIFLGLRINIWSAIAGIALGIAVIVIQSRRHPGLEVTVYMPGREQVAPAPADGGQPAIEQPAIEQPAAQSDTSNDHGTRVESDK
jgi:hypothetical protein